MCELFAFNSDVPARATFALEEFRQHGCATGPHCDGWGLAFYDGHNARIFREARPAAFSEWMDFLLHHEHFSATVISHIRHATQGGINLTNTQPFSRECQGRRHVFAHNGNLKGLQPSPDQHQYNPIGDTDSELAFCLLMNQVAESWCDGDPSLATRFDVLSQQLSHWSTLGPANIIYGDGEYLFAFGNRRTQSNGKIEPPGLFYLMRAAHDDHPVELDGVYLECPGQSMTLFASVPLSDENWTAVSENELLVCRDGEVVMRRQL